MLKNFYVQCYSLLYSTTQQSQCCSHFFLYFQDALARETRFPWLAQVFPLFRALSLGYPSSMLARPRVQVRGALAVEEFSMVLRSVCNTVSRCFGGEGVGR